MSVGKINIDETITKVERSLREDKRIPPEFRVLVELLLLVVRLLVKKLNTNSSNSSKPPSMDPNRERGPKQDEEGKKQTIFKDSAHLLPGGNKALAGFIADKIMGEKLLKE